jgi:enoyl-CoA hydratase/carnithine racemase
MQREMHYLFDQRFSAVLRQWRIALFAVPIVAALVGPCIGAGVDLACCADIRLCSRSTKFSIHEV